MKKIILFLCALMYTGSFFAQSSSTIEFLYDAAGNRISRSIPVVQLRSYQSSQKTEVVTSKEKILDYNISVYPNPTVGEVNLSINGKAIDDKTELSVYNTSGSQVCSVKVTGETTRIDLSNSPNGIYLLRLSIAGQIISWKVIKK